MSVRIGFNHRSIMKAVQMASIPSGVIVMWSGSLANIPSGWALCDGADGRPDLRNMFVMGAPPGEEPGGTGGSISLSHTVTQPSDHPALSHSVTQPNDHPALGHSGTAVADHTNVNVPATATAAVKIGTSSSTAAAQTHTHTIASITHSVTQPDSHPALSHSGTAVSDHPALSHSGVTVGDHMDIRPPYYKVAFIIKL
jgi:hypothetical protein